MSCGLGDGQYLIAACIDKRPAFMHLEQLEGWQGMVDGEIAAIGNACGNGWRKVFNVYAKLLWAMAKDPVIAKALRPALSSVATFDRWQDYRDACLLRSDSGTALLFSEPCFSEPTSSGSVLSEAGSALKVPGERAETQPLHIIMGRGYGKALACKAEAPFSLEWLNDAFAIDRHRRVIVCPYFDYRQLSDARIDTLVGLVKSLFVQNSGC
ncbi:hypothetical protein VXM60_15985 [Shewanella khirikhana]|uniref:DUF6942 family protein n=1 Tax=Shewanella khirikhana TaxID=1965282 RepID=UPI0030CE8B8B